MELIRNGAAAKLMESGAVLKTAFCGPCFGAGDTPANGGFSIRHSTRNFPNREGSKLQSGQIASVALMDARSIAATAANGGMITAATDIDYTDTHKPYHFDDHIYKSRIYNGFGKADLSVELRYGPNIKDWPKMYPMEENMLVELAAVIHDPVTTTDELIPSGETSSYRSNPLGLAEFALSRKDPEYVGRAKAVQVAQKALEAGESAGKAVPEVGETVGVVKKTFPEVSHDNLGVGSTIFAVKPGDGSAKNFLAACRLLSGGAVARFSGEEAAAEAGVLRIRVNKGKLPQELFIALPF